MIRDITIGQYYPADSLLHRLDPRVKFVGTIMFLVSLFVADSFWGYLLATVFLAAIITMSKVPVKFNLNQMNVEWCMTTQIIGNLNFIMMF